MDESGSRSVFPPSLAPPPAASPPPASPPTTRWPRPPVSDTPPRPAGFGPPSSLAGPPPPPDPQVPAEPSGESGRGRGRTLLRAAGIGVVALSLVSGGFALGTVLDDADPPTQSVDTVRPAVDLDASTGPLGSSTLPADVDGPVAEDAAVEPAAAVAAAVNPSVVQISTNAGQGSGIVWDAADGYIITNDHVTTGSQSVQVRFADGSVVVGEVVGGSSTTDVAVVRVDPTEISLVEAVFAPTSTVQVGQLAVAIGSPFGLDQSVTAGIVSAVRINPYGGSDPTLAVPVEMIQTDAPINAGNSGGALADRQGRVIGMNTSIRTDGRSEGNVGVGFALPSDTIVLIAGRIVRGEPLDLGYLGVSGSPETDSAGVLVTEVVAGSPADEAGIDVGDLIVGLDGDPVREISELSAAIKLYRPGDMVEVQIERDDTAIAVTVELGRLSAN